MKSSSFGQVYRLTKHRWLILVALALLVIGLELLENFAMAVIPDQFEAAAEVVIEVILFPVCIVLLLDILAQIYRERTTAINTMALFEGLDNQLEQARTWEELAKVIVSFPSTFLPMIGSRLFVFVEDTQQFEFESAGGFESQPQTLMMLNCTELSIQSCQAVLAPASETPHFCTCSLPGGLNGGEFKRMCLPLLHASRPVGILHLYLPSYISITDESQAIIAHMVIRMALAIDNARLMRQASRSNALLQAERKRISHDLHDILGQDLAYLTNKLEQLASEQAPVNCSVDHEELQRMHSMANEAYEVVRGTLVALRAGDTGEFVSMMEDFADDVGKRAGFKVTFNCLGDIIPISADGRFQMFSIFREALANVERHASASQVLVRLLFARDGLMMDIKDNGKGFDSLALSKGSSHYGLHVIEERTSHLNGVLQLISAPGAGTQVSVKLPIASLLQ